MFLLIDSFKAQLEEAAQSGTGFWFKGDLVRVVEGEETYPDPAAGHQQMWVHPSHQISLIYDRSLNANPDRLD